MFDEKKTKVENLVRLSLQQHTDDIGSGPECQFMLLGREEADLLLIGPFYLPHLLVGPLRITHFVVWAGID
jgi:hypothetical protein